MATLDKKRMKQKKRKLKIAVFTSTLAELIITPYIAYVIHQYATLVMNPSGKLKFSISYSYISSIRMLFLEFGVQLWFVLLQACYIFWIIWLIIKPRGEITTINEIWVTDKIKIPVAVGNGQHGSARFSTEQEKKRLFQKFDFAEDKELNAPCNLVVEMKKYSNREVIRYLENDIHTLVLGTTGAGKTRRILLQSVCLQLLSELSCVISDVKGEIFYYTSPFAEKRGYRVIAIDFRNPRKSAHYNFTQPVLEALEKNDIAQAIDATWDLVSVLVGEQKGEPLWYNGETSAIAAGILAVCMGAPKNCRNLTNVYYFLAYMCQPDSETGKLPLSLYLATLEDTHPAKTVFAMAQIAADRTKSSFFTSALGTLKLFANPNVAEMTSYSDFRLGDIGNEKTIFYMMIPDENKKLYPLASIMVQQIYMAQVELANKNGLRLPVDTVYDLDEVGNFPTIPVLSNMLSAGRSRGVCVNLFIQDYQQLQSKYKDDFETIKACCKAKIYLKSDNTKTLEEISKTLDKYTVEVTSASTSSNVSAKGSDGSISNSSNMAGRELLMISDLSMIDYPYALCMKAGEHPSITELPDLSQYSLNKILGLGDKEHNRKIVMERENAREERQIGSPELWGIWREYEEIIEEDSVSQVSFLT